MATPTVTDYLKYANLQMAAEAFIGDPLTGVLKPSGQDLIDVLIDGNFHTSKFTETQATDFCRVMGSGGSTSEHDYRVQRDSF